MLGQPLYHAAAAGLGFRLTGALQAGATATDLVLTVTQILRKHAAWSASSSSSSAPA